MATRERTDEEHIVGDALQLKHWAEEVIRLVPARAVLARGGSAEIADELRRLRALFKKVHAVTRGGRVQDGQLGKVLTGAVAAAVAQKDGDRLQTAFDHLADGDVDRRDLDIDALKEAIALWGTDAGYKALGRAVAGTAYELKWTTLRTAASDRRTGRSKPRGRRIKR